MANKSGLGQKEDWGQFINEVKTQFEGYASAHAHYISEGGNAAYGVVQMGGGSKNSSHNHSVIKEGWPQLHSFQGYTTSGHVAPVDFEEAKPFIRFVIERMLDLMATEENWVKGQSHAKGDNGQDQYCLIGALGQAVNELGLSMKGNSALNRSRARVCAAIEKFMLTAVMDDKGHQSMPSFNDSSETTYEDVRLWLKGLFDKLDD